MDEYGSRADKVRELLTGRIMKALCNMNIVIIVCTAVSVIASCIYGVVKPPQGMGDLGAIAYLLVFMILACLFAFVLLLRFYRYRKVIRQANDGTLFAGESDSVPEVVFTVLIQTAAAFFPLRELVYIAVWVRPEVFVSSVYDILVVIVVPIFVGAPIKTILHRVVLWQITELAGKKDDERIRKAPSTALAVLNILQAVSILLCGTILICDQRYTQEFGLLFPIVFGCFVGIIIEIVLLFEYKRRIKETRADGA